MNVAVLIIAKQDITLSSLRVLDLRGPKSHLLRLVSPPRGTVGETFLSRFKIGLPPRRQGHLHILSVSPWH